MVIKAEGRRKGMRRYMIGVSKLDVPLLWITLSCFCYGVIEALWRKV
ncbi:hypothetical protein PAE0482 [Pyrobaculum aerophilum str. IM2]|uniref:Uncharacterized protein n=1 Tax=Pyrobaculum aerophilum (strain ATCC 51768 / DSM 7523 / JCM 9630 / CIP 104966 / NBRC 100827 / IM2) TaxID=178306 RepID=Q8ZZ20_PYRAE|nr:hypothetical protein PAE0482 [Pyrobaculum aerophilum str. IM2]